MKINHLLATIVYSVCVKQKIHIDFLIDPISFLVIVVQVVSDRSKHVESTAENYRFMTPYWF